MHKIISISELTNPKFIKPIKLNYELHGEKREWEAVISHDSVSIILWHTQKRAFIVVKQLRVPVLNSNEWNGMMYELCAGILDKDISHIQTAKEEILEECGYDIDIDNIQKITSFYTNVGISGSEQTLYYAECDDSMKLDAGGGLEEEDIEVIYIDIDDAKNFMFDTKYQKTPGLLMGFYWFFDNIKV